MKQPSQRLPSTKREGDNGGYKKFFLTILSFEKYIGSRNVRVWGGVSHEINRVGWDGWLMKSTGCEVCHAEVGWVIQGWGGDEPHPCMTHPTPPLHDTPHPCMTHPTPT